MKAFKHTEVGSRGRIAYARIGPNEDLVTAIEKICIAQQFSNAIVRGGLGSLTDAHLYKSDGTHLVVKGPAIEIVTLTGSVHAVGDGSCKATIAGLIADIEGHVSGGEFVPGMNSVCITVEVTLEEWIPQEAS